MVAAFRSRRCTAPLGKMPQNFQNVAELVKVADGRALGGDAMHLIAPELLRSASSATSGGRVETDRRQPAALELIRRLLL
jgi:hypothetical protein